MLEFVIRQRRFLIFLVLLIVVFAAVIYWRSGSIGQDNDGVGSATSTELVPNNLGLSLPAGFSISKFADVPGARVMAFDQYGNMWVSQPRLNQISAIEIDKDSGAVRGVHPAFRNLNSPHGVAFDPENPLVLYIAEEDKISRVTTYSDDRLRKIADLPIGSGHSTRTIGFGPDKRLYVSIGSSCNACKESDNRRAKIFSMNSDGSDFKEFASGLRNSVFFTWRNEVMWATDMGRDWLGDNLPPDEINIVTSGRNYGWPICYGKNIRDKSVDDSNSECKEPSVYGSYVDIPAHSAPLGLAFVAPQNGWPEDFVGDLIVAYHGSWNRTVPTGYKLVRVKLGSDSSFEGTEDFAVGWISNGKVTGRPVDLVFRGGSLFVSDDDAGVVYKIEAKTAE